jgi:hypothetical protein
VNTRLHLDDLRQAWQAHDPGLADLIATLATQSDEPTDKPVREGAPTFQRFLREIRSHSFARRPKAEQAHFRVEQIKALEAPEAEAPLSDRLRLHEIILGMWNEDSLYARTMLLRVIATVPLRYGAWRALKRIFKESEARGDTEIYGALAARLDSAYAGWQSHDPARRTLAYLVRRAWRFLRQMGTRLPIEYPDAAVDVLVHYTDRTNWNRTWVANHIFYHETGKYSRGSFRLFPMPKSLLEHRAYPDLWRRSPRPLFNLLERAQSDPARAFATEALRTDFRAVLREVEAAWVARLVSAGSAAIDEFVVWILNNVPRFEQGAFRTLGLHDAVLRMLDSPSDKAREYAAGYARTHARDLPVAELVRLVDNSSKAVSRLALDLLSERHPRDDIGLDAWGWLLETENGHDLASKVLRQHFGAAELTPEWFAKHLFTENESAFEVLKDLLLHVHPLPKLGPRFFTGLLDAINDPTAGASERVAEFALENLAKLDVNTLDREALQGIFLNPQTRHTAAGWVGEGRLQMRALPVGFWKVLGYRPAWDADPWVAALRQDGRAWTRDLQFDEGFAGTVLGWLSDPRHVPPAELGLDWLLQLVDSNEDIYHNFAVETIIKGFVPADFAPGQARAETAAPTAPAAVDLSGQSFLFTGKMATMQRKDAENKVKEAGGTVAGSVTKKLCYLVIGDEGSPLYSGGQKGEKQTKAEQLNAAGANILIISETAFLQMLAGGIREAASSDTVRSGCERLWEMALAPGTPNLRRAELARQYIRRHHVEIGPSETSRPVDPGAEIPPDFLTFERVKPLFNESRKPLRDFALELARWELARWSPPAEELLALSELPHPEVRHFIAEALLAEDVPENRRFRINPDTLTPAAVYQFCESADADTRKLGMQLIQRSSRLRVPEELFRLTESPDRLVRNFVVRELWSLYRDRGVTADWKPPVPPAPTLGAAAKKAAATPEPRGPGVPHRPEKLPAEKPSLSAFLRRALFEIPPGRPEGGPAAVPGQQAQQQGRRLKPLPARKAKLSLVEVMRDLALEDGAFATGILPLLEEFMVSRGVSERAACLVAITRIGHRHPDVKPQLLEVRR